MTNLQPATISMSRASCSKSDNFSLLKLKQGTAAKVTIHLEVCLDPYKSAKVKPQAQLLVAKDLVANLRGHAILFRGKKCSIMQPPRGEEHIQIFPVTATLQCEKDVLRLITTGDTLYYWKATVKGNLYHLLPDEDEYKYPFIDL